MENKYGTLLKNNIKIYRNWFKEACKLLGIYVLYRAPLKDKHWTTYTEIESNYYPPIKVGCLFHDHPDQKTLKKVGWVAELQEGASLIEVDYDLPLLQRGGLFIVPSGIDGAKGRLFTISSMYNSMVYPASITCEIVPEYENTLEESTHKDYSTGSFNLISEEDDIDRQFLTDKKAYNRLIDEADNL